MAAVLGNITLPPTPSPGRSLQEVQLATAVWTRQAEQTVRQIEKYLHESTSGSAFIDAPSDGQTYGRKNGAWTVVTTPAGGNLTETGSSILTITGGTGAVIGSGTTIQVTQADTTHNGFLSSTDWNTFNGKVSSSRQILTTAPLQGGGNLSADRTLSITQATTSTDGYLSSTDWNTFNGKQSALTFGNLTETSSSILTITNGTGAVIGSGTTIAVTKADATHNGYLSSVDWNTFNGKANAFTSGNLTETGSSILTITGGTGAVLGSGTTVQVTQADATHNGFLTSTDWGTFNGKLSDAPSDGNTYARKNAAWTAISTSGITIGKAIAFSAGFVLP